MKMENSALVSIDFSLEDWMHNPLDDTEVVDGQLVEKKPVTLKHSRIQGNLYFYWRSYKDERGLGGQVYTNVPCCTNKQGLRPDVAYITPDLITQLGEPDVFPQGFPLVAEIVSPTDWAEEIITKSQEYLQSGSQEVWLVFPENRWIIVLTHNQRLVFTSGDIIYTQSVLKGFQVTVDELLT
jgi:Uma2 family endonuclease